MPASPVNASTDLASFVIKANQAEVQGKYEIIAFEVEHALNRIPMARIVIRDGSAAEESFTVAAGKDFAPGAKIEIQAGYHQKTKPIFSGVVVKTAIQHKRSGESTLCVHCREAAAAMTLGRRSACYSKTTDSAVMQKLIGDYQLTADVTSTSAQLEELTQFAATDWDFLISRAEANGFVVSVRDGKVSVKAPQFSASPVLTVTYGVDMFDVDLEEDARAQRKTVKCNAWDHKKQEVVSASETTTNDNPLGNDEQDALAKVGGSAAFELTTPAPLVSSDLSGWAKAQLMKFSLAKIRGTVRFQGSSLVTPGSVVELAGLGERFDGNAYVSAVRHELQAGDWNTEVTIGLAPEWFAAQADVSVPAARALLPGAHGLHVGTVKRIDQDPAGEVRVLVKVPLIDAKADGIWARLARPYASTNAGFYFYPETNDEVVLAFLDGDPRYPVVVGSLHSSTRTAPFTPDNKNTNKGIVTREQMKLTFDEEKKVITIVTPAANKIEINDDQKTITITDQHSNMAKFSSDGILLKSASDIVLKATKNITMEAGAALSATAQTDATVKGLNVTLTANSEFKASANLNASLTANVQTVIKGSAMVMIN